MTGFLALARAIHFVSLMMIFGGSGYAALLRRGRICELPLKSVRAVFTVAATLALVSGIAWFCLVAGQMSGSWRGAADPTILRMAAFETRFGHIFLARLIGLVALLSICTMKRSSIVAMPVLGGLLLASLAPVSHAAATMDGEIAITGAINDAVHLLAAASWLGGLTVLVLLIPRHWTDPAALAGPLRIFSSWGSAVVALLVLTGVINALAILPVSRMSLHNPYSELLLTKVGAVAVMVCLAALNRWRFAPALPSGGESVIRQLASSVGLELVLALLVVSLVGSLGTIAPY